MEISRLHSKFQGWHHCKNKPCLRSSNNCIRHKHKTGKERNYVSFKPVKNHTDEEFLKRHFHLSTLLSRSSKLLRRVTHFEFIPHVYLWNAKLGRVLEALFGLT